MTTRRLTIALVCQCVLAVSAGAADHYVRSDAPAGGNGSNWTSAWTQLPTSLVRGDTYYIADGSYPGYTFDDANVGESTITLCKATAADHGTDVGWQGAYGDGQALFTGGLNVVTGYHIFDGRTRAADWASGYGFKIDASGSKGINIGSSSTTANHVTVRYVEIQGRGRDGAGSPANDLVYVLPEVRGLKFQHCYLHDAGRTAWLLRNTDDGLIEYCRVSRNESTAEQHSEAISALGTDRWTIRYNLWEDIEGTGIIVFVGDLWQLYGNVCYETGTPPYGGTSNGSFCTWTGSAVTNARIHNNTFIACTGLNQGFYFDGAHAVDNKAYNNLWYNCEKVGIGGATGDYNSWLATPVRFGTTPQTHDVVDANAVDPFVAWAAGNFHLKAATAAGMTLPAPFTSDMLGAVRGADGHWDRGALEYVAGNIASDGWQVVARHGQADVVTPMADDYVEPRRQGLRRFRVAFTGALDPATVAKAVVTLVGDASGDQAARIDTVVLEGDRTLLVTLTTSLPDADRYTVAITSALHLAGGQPVSGDLDLRLATLVGDVDSSGVVGAADIVAVRDRADQPIDATTARYDVDLSGAITGNDILAVRETEGRQLP